MVVVKQRFALHFTLVKFEPGDIKTLPPFKIFRYKKTPVKAEVYKKLVSLIMLFLHLLPANLFCLLPHRM